MPLPIITSGTIESQTVNPDKALKRFKVEQPLLYCTLDEYAEEDSKDWDAEGAFLLGAAIMYSLLVRQDESDTLEREVNM